jgi:hypothetical protein
MARSHLIGMMRNVMRGSRETGGRVPKKMGPPHFNEEVFGMDGTKKLKEEMGNK